MTTSDPPSRGASQLLSPATPSASLERRPPAVPVPGRPAQPTTLTLPGVRRRGPKGEAIVVIANPPPYSQLIISFQQDRDRPGPSGVSVAVQAIPCFVEGEDEDSATRVFDRQSVIPGLPYEAESQPGARAEPAAPAPVPGERSVAAAAAAPCLAAPSTPRPPTPEELRDAARGAQDTYRYVASTARPEQGPIVSRWLLVPVACIAASLCALFYLHQKDDDTRQLAPAALANVVPKPVREVVITGAALGEAQPLPVSRPETLKPRQEDDSRPSARIELRELGLNVTSTPWMEVLIDGRSVGNTPQLHLQLTPGKHDVELLNRDLGLETHAYVYAERGSEETQEIAFE